MLTSGELLRSYAQLLHRLCGAESVSLYLLAAPEWLIHDNGHAAVPELADADAARQLLPAGAPLLRPLVSRDPGGRLIPVPVDPRLERRHRSASRGELPGDRRRLRADGDSALWIGLRLAEQAVLPAGDLWRRALVLGGALAGHCQRADAVLHDPVTELPGRADFQATLRREAETALGGGRPLALLLTNPDDFSLVNERFGSEAGDAVVREIAGRLRGALRRSDLVHRYGGVVFAVLLPGVARVEAVAVAEKLHDALSGEAYLDGALRLGFSFGLATLEEAGAGKTAARRHLGAPPASGPGAQRPPSSPPAAGWWPGAPAPAKRWWSTATG